MFKTATVIWVKIHFLRKISENAVYGNVIFRRQGWCFLSPLLHPLYFYSLHLFFPSSSSLLLLSFLSLITPLLPDCFPPLSSSLSFLFSFPCLWLLSTMQKYGLFTSIYYHICYPSLVGQLSDKIYTNVATLSLLLCLCAFVSSIHQFPQTIWFPALFSSPVVYSLFLYLVSRACFNFVFFLPFLHHSSKLTEKALYKRAHKF